MNTQRDASANEANAKASLDGGCDSPTRLAMLAFTGSAVLSAANRSSDETASRVLRAQGKKLTNIVHMMSDDQGWGELGYRGHKILKTPHMCEMARSGLRLERFYVSPICSPTRAAVLTGRAGDRTGVVDQGQPMHVEEQKTVARALQKAGWATGHFGARALLQLPTADHCRPRVCMSIAGKWHLDGLHSVGMGGGTILANHSHNPSAFGFSYWVSSFGVFEVDPPAESNGSGRRFCWRQL